MPETVSPEELAWRDWVLGQGHYQEHGPRNPDARAETGAPTRIPTAWWQRLEAFLAGRHEGTEPGETPAILRRALVAVRAPIPRAADASILSPHFKLAEFRCKDGTAVPKAAVPSLKRLCDDVLEPLRERFGPCTVMSGYRPSAYNRSIGGAKFSQHIYDLHPSTVAADLTFASGRPTEWADGAEPLLQRGGLGRYPGFVHVDNRGVRARW